MFLHAGESFAVYFTNGLSVASAAVFGKAEKENAKRNRPSSAKKQPGVQAVLIRGMLW